MRGEWKVAGCFGSVKRTPETIFGLPLDATFRGRNMRTMSQPSQTVGHRLKALRAKRGLTMRELAASAGVNSSVISLIENNKRPPNWRQLQGLAKALRVSIRDLIPPRAA